MTLAPRPGRSLPSCNPGQPRALVARESRPVRSAAVLCAIDREERSMAAAAARDRSRGSPAVVGQGHRWQRLSRKSEVLSLFSQTSPYEQSHWTLHLHGASRFPFANDNELHLGGASPHPSERPTVSCAGSQVPLVDETTSLHALPPFCLHVSPSLVSSTSHHAA